MREKLDFNWFTVKNQGTAERDKLKMEWSKVKKDEDNGQMQIWH